MILPPTLRRLLGLVQQHTYYHSWKPGEWELYYMATHRLGLNLQLAYRLMDAGPLPARFRYRHFNVPKKDGSVREIVEPGPDLKAAQRKILKHYLSKVQPHSTALGFRRKKSIADHAWAHAGAAIMITADIQDFFPNTSRYRVKAWWRSQGYSTLETRLLTTLTTYRGSLPQGAPTSPPLSNLVNAELDAAIERRVRACGGRYTRYADDIVFSWPDGYGPPADFEQAVRALLREYGYLLHPQKGWNIWRRQDQPEVTGVILTRRGTVELPDSMRRVIRLLELSADTADADDQARLAGYRGYEAMVTKRKSTRK